MRYVEITHVYVLPVDADDVEAVDAIVNAGCGIMEHFIKGRASNIRRLRSDWTLLPKEYVPEDVALEKATEGDLTFEPAQVPTKEEFGNMANREADRIQSLKMIEADIDQGISFAGDVMGQGAAKVTHPWDQGLRIFPISHEMAIMETEALRQNKMLCGRINPNDLSLICIGIEGHQDNHLWAPAASVLPPGTTHIGEVSDG